MVVLCALSFCDPSIDVGFENAHRQGAMLKNLIVERAQVEICAELFFFTLRLRPSARAPENLFGLTVSTSAG